MWSENHQTTIGGETVTWGPCADPRYAGKWFVSIGSRYSHTTFIVSPNLAKIHEIKARGTDKDIWRSVAVAVLGS